MSTLFLVLYLSIIKLSNAGLYQNCYECFGEICCDDPITKIDTLVCAHWTSSSGSFGAPLDICFGSFGGAEVSSVSQMYKCADDGSTVNLYQYTGCSDCSCTPYLMAGFGAIFNPTQYPDRDTFNCSGPPCPYYVIEDGTAHPTQTCPYDVGKGGVSGGNYATWQVKLILEGCQSFGTNSTLLKCDSSDGILQMNFGNDRCDFDPNNGGGNTNNKTLDGGAVECNVDPPTLGYGTGRSVYCSEEVITSTPTTAAPTTVSPTTTDPTTADPTSVVNTHVPTTSAPTTSDPTDAGLVVPDMPTTASPTKSEPTTSEPTAPDTTDMELDSTEMLMELTSVPSTSMTSSASTSMPTNENNDPGDDGCRYQVGLYIVMIFVYIIFN